MRTETPQTIYLKDYRVFPYKIKNLSLNFDIHDGHTIVTAASSYECTEEKPGAVLYLDGEDLELISLKVDGKKHADYLTDEKSIRIMSLPEKFDLEIVTKIYPEKNTRLEGLYKSSDTYCTQCEAEGFRRITYYPDRPDILTTFTTRIEASKDYPVLLSNGNRIDGDEIGEDRHFTIWEDPHPKPCYLFALVAGDLSHIQDKFVTKSGREVDLYIYVHEGNEYRCIHAMESLKRAMLWDEEVYGREYDLDLFNIVAVSDFNMGAMENKSLNIFNTALVLAHQDTATDQDFIRVEGVIAHEYFHNWSGNRVTCRDWFQLSLKEGLTVFRDQSFSADMHSKDVQRIDDVTHLRRFQFAEDESPLAHPIRPDNYIEINNFYTMTVYEKGAEVIRMIRTLIGEENYRKGTDLYFERHDGQAVTCDDFVKAMEDASGTDLSQFKLWYSQAGLPRVKCATSYDKKEQRFDVTLSQHVPDTRGQRNKKPMVIPIALGLVGPGGEDYIGTQVLVLNQKEQKFSFDNIPERPVPSFLRGFSAPIRIETGLKEEDYSFLMRKEKYDGFNRWSAGQNLASKALCSMLDRYELGGEKKPELSPAFVESYGHVLEDALAEGADKALLARAMALPDIGLLIQEREHADPENIHRVRELVLATLKREHKKTLEKIYKANAPSGEFSISSEEMARRALRNAALQMLTATHGSGCAKRAKEHYKTADNMTDRVAALASLTNNNSKLREDVFADFYKRYKKYPLVIDKWFSLQAISTLPQTVDRLKKLRAHKDFNIKNPNRVRALYAAFALNNPAIFHAKDGSGYTFLRDIVIELNTINPQIGARMLTPMREWQKYTPDRQEMMKKALRDILDVTDLAPDIFEIASKSLGE